MTQTVISGSASYCSATQFLQRYDYRSVGQLLTDSDTAAAPSQAAVLADTTLAALLKEGSGEVELACLLGGRYTAADLTALGTTNAGEKLAGLVADWVMWRIYDRRPERAAEMPERCKRADVLLQALAAGERVFGFQEAADAGREHGIDLNAGDLERKQSAITQARRYFGRRAQNWDE